MIGKIDKCNRLGTPNVWGPFRQKRLRNRRAAGVFRLFGYNLNLGGAGLGCHPAPVASIRPRGATQFLGASVSAGFRFRGLTIRLLP